ncbi:MAG: DNA double-strand break repair protein Mre11 [Haloferacaceae archaeon]
MIRLLHTADTHLGYRQYHSPERRDDFMRAFERVIDDAVDADVDAVVHAGDLYHDRRPDLPDLVGTVEALSRLRDASIPFLAVVGNHESTRHGQWLDVFERLDLAERLGREPRRVGDAALYGLDHVPRAQRDDLDYDFASHDAPHALLVAHGLFTPFAHADWETEAVLSRSSVPFDALLLGDNHEPGVERVGDRDVWATYPGSTERASASERTGRGYNLVDVDGDEAGPAGVTIRRRALDTRSFVFVDVELAPGEGVDRVRERVRQHDLTDAVVIVRVEGDGEPIAPAAVEEAAQDAGAMIARVTDGREIEDEAETPDVSFADPDEAVRERVREAGLSPAGADIDRTVRAPDVADSNVRERVKRGVERRLEDGLDAFEGVVDDGDVGRGDATEAGSDTSADTDESGVPAEATGRDDDPDDRPAGERDEASPAPDDGDGSQVTMEDFS